jgi:hypothetical protein
MVMPRNVTIQFNDGTSHVYEDVPDEIHDDEVKARANSQFDKNVSQISAEPINTQPQYSPATQELINAQEKAMAVPIGLGQAGLGAANQFLQSPLGHMAEIGGGGAYTLNKIGQMIKPPNGPVAPSQAVAPAVPQTQQATGTYGRPNLTLQQGGGAGQQAFNQMGQQLTKPSIPSSNIIDEATKLSQSVQKTAASKIAGLGNFLGKAGLAGQMAMALGYTSPEEIAVLKEAEARKRAQGWLPLNER